MMQNFTNGVQNVPGILWLVLLFVIIASVWVYRNRVEILMAIDSLFGADVEPSELDWVPPKAINKFEQDYPEQTGI